MPLTIPVDRATNEVDYQAFEVRKREAEAKGMRLVTWVMLEISCIILNVQELLYLPFDYDYRFDLFTAWNRKKL